MRVFKGLAHMIMDNKGASVAIQVPKPSVGRVVSFWGDVSVLLYSDSQLIRRGPPPHYGG